MAEQLRTLIGTHPLHVGVERIAHRLNDYHDRTDEEPVVIVPILKAAMFFACDLLQLLTFPTEVEFVTASSYQGTTEAQQAVEIHPVSRDFYHKLERRKVLVLDTIYDTGATLAAMKKVMDDVCTPQSVMYVVLLRKQKEQLPLPENHVTGIAIPDVFVVGYGLDYQERYRGLRKICELHR